MMTEHSPWHLLHVLQRLVKERAALDKTQKQETHPPAFCQSDAGARETDDDTASERVISEMDPPGESLTEVSENQGLVARFFPDRELHRSRELEMRNGELPHLKENPGPREI